MIRGRDDTIKEASGGLGAKSERAVPVGGDYSQQMLVHATRTGRTRIEPTY